MTEQTPNVNGLEGPVNAVAHSLKKINNGSCFLYAEDYSGMEKTGAVTA
jgi:hypothetical protein